MQPPQDATTREFQSPDGIRPRSGPPRRRRRRHSRRRLGRRLLGIGFLVVLLAAGGLAWSVDREPVREVLSISLDPAPLRPPKPATAPLRVKRPAYRYSVVHGGVYDREELAIAMRTDPAVATHYQDFDLTRTVVTRVTEPRTVHVSYRVGDKIYWSSRKIRLRPGEALLSDGVSQARVRCGNRIADVPQGEPAPEEPAPEELDEVVPEPAGIEPLAAYDLMFPVEIPPVPADPIPSFDVPLPATPMAYSAPPFPPVIPRGPDPPPPGPIPEPGTLSLLGLGAGLAGLRAWHRRRRASR